MPRTQHVAAAALRGFAGQRRLAGIHYDDAGDPAAYMAEHEYTFPVILEGSDVVNEHL
jgi:hypothetical protein